MCIRDSTHTTAEPSETLISSKLLRYPLWLCAAAVIATIISTHDQTERTLYNFTTYITAETTKKHVKTANLGNLDMAICNVYYHFYLCTLRGRACDTKVGERLFFKRYDLERTVGSNGDFSLPSAFFIFW